MVQISNIISQQQLTCLCSLNYAKDRYYAKFLCKHLGTGVAQTTRMAQLLQKLLRKKLCTDVIQTKNMAEMLQKLLRNNLRADAAQTAGMIEILHEIMQ